MFSREARPEAATAPVAPARPLPGSPVARLRPRTGPQILDAGFDVMRFRAGTITVLLVVLYGPFFAGSLWMLHHSGNGLFAPLLVERLWSGPSFDLATTGELVWIGSSIVCGLLGDMLFGVGLSTLMRGWLDGHDPSPRTVVASTLRRLPVIVGVWLIALVLKLLGAAICLIGLLLFLPQLSLLAPVMAFERGSPYRLLERSRALVNRASDKALLLTLVTPLLSFLIPWGLRLGGSQGFSRLEEFSTVMAVVATLVLTVARTSAMTLLYLDIRVRSEGLDLALRAPDALGQPT